MNMNKAIAVLGINRTRAGDLVPMVRALEMCAAMNCPAENERLDAASYVLRNWAAYQRECSARRDAIHARRTGRA